MSAFFFDSSALIKRYIFETGTAWVKMLTDPRSGNIFYIARITGVEVVAAIARRRRGGSTTPGDAAVALTQFDSELLGLYRSLEISASLIEEAKKLAERHALRGYDAVQLAAALEINAQRVQVGLPSVMLLSADSELNAAALAEGLAVDNPNAHP
jgi:predicted nucleic acid-binding protein